jgi:SAM-dependent methyltransferase
VSGGEVRHPVFARVYSALVAADAVREEPLRRELLAGLAGVVVEPGPGPGTNFGLYPAGVTEVVAVEPEPYMRLRATAAAASAPAPVRVVDGRAEALPVPDGSADAVVCCLMLCSVDQPAVLAEALRVLRPGGELRFLEHVVARSPKLRRTQRVLAPVWPHVAGGCRLDHDTVGAIEGAGFELVRARHLHFSPSATTLPVAPHAIGVARRPEPVRA